MTIQNPTGPSLTNNNDVFSSLDFRGVNLGMTALTGMTVTVGSVVYTLGSNWLPKFFDGVTNISPIELADSLVEAINGTYENAPDISVITTSIGRANSDASAYHTNGVVHFVRRNGSTPTIGSTVTGATPTASAPSAPTSVPSVPTGVTTFGTGTATTTPTAMTGSAKQFEVENLSTTIDILIDNVFIVKPLMGTSVLGSPSSHTIASASSTAAYQLKLSN